jgi:hypothetical protein
MVGGYVIKKLRGSVLRFSRGAGFAANPLSFSVTKLQNSAAKIIPVT